MVPRDESDSLKATRWPLNEGSVKHLMHALLGSDVMPRTTIDIDASVLRQLEERKRREGKTLGRLASELLARALAADDAAGPSRLVWTSAPMRARVDLEDKEALRRALDGS
jgi:hypothetical protein